MLMLHRNPQLLKRVKQQVRFTEWETRRKLPEHLLVWRFFLFGTELPRWALHRVRAVQVPGGPRQIRSIWVPESHTETFGIPGVQPSRAPFRAATATAPVLHADLYECPNLRSAHEFLVGLLGEFQLPGVFPDFQSRIGDVFFAGTDQVAVFVRANLVILMRNVGGEPAPVPDLAADLDLELIRSPEPKVPAAAKSAGAAKATTLQVALGSRTPLPLDPGLRRRPPQVRSAALAGTPAEVAVPSGPMCKIYSRLGEVVQEDGQLLYSGDQLGTDDVTLVAIHGAGIAARHKWRVRTVESGSNA
jgi:hypothetical protein